MEKEKKYRHWGWWALIGMVAILILIGLIIAAVATRNTDEMNEAIIDDTAQVDSEDNKEAVNSETNKEDEKKEEKQDTPSEEKQNTKNKWMQYAYKQQAHGQKETWLAQYLKNMDQGLINAAGDALRTSQFHQAQDIKDRELNIWQQQVDLEKLKRYDDLARMGTNNLNPVQNFIRNWFFAGNRI